MLLEGIRVLDLTYFIAGPVGTQVLADLGAEVIKIEGPRASTRTQVLENGSGDDSGRPSVVVGQPVFSNLNRNKRSLALDLTKPQGTELFKDLVRISDLVVENYSLRVMRNFGLEFPVIQAVNPRIIMISMPGYGQDGPYKEYPSWGETIESTSGMTNLTGYADGPPLRSAIYMPDPLTGMHAALAAIVCLNQRGETGKGQHVTLSHLECATQLVGEAIVDFAMNDRIQVREGNNHPYQAPHGIYPCLGDDEWVAIAVGTDDEWRALCDTLGHPTWTRMSEFNDALSRHGNQESLSRHLSQWTRGHSKHDIMLWLQQAGVPAGAVLNAEDLVSDPHLINRRFFWEYGDTLGEGPVFPYAGRRAKYEGNPERAGRRAPGFGEHNAYVLEELLNLSAVEINRLRDLEVVLDVLPDP